MADADDGKKLPAIPSWQQTPLPLDTTSSPAKAPEQSTDKPPKLDLLEHARRFLDDESIRDASREKKEAFLRQKAVPEEQIQKLLSEPISPGKVDEQQLKTVHDSTSSISEQQLLSAQTGRAPSAPAAATTATVTPRNDIPPIITYPEFLLKPQKPPPLVTLDRLASAAYVFAGVSALTYGASKYLVQPMLESLSNARHDVYDTTQTSLSKLNNKLESSVSHVPYIPPLHPSKLPDEDVESIDSDPTELFHRDIGIQTSPPHSRSSSFSSQSKTAASAIADQASRLSALHTTLSSLLSSTETHFSEDSLKKTISNFQVTVTEIEGNSQPLTSPWNAYNLTPSQSTTDLVTTAKAINASEKPANTSTKSDKDSEAAKFKAEIRALKGAFLSSRSFPTVRPAMPFNPKGVPGTQGQSQAQAQTTR